MKHQDFFKLSDKDRLSYYNNSYHLCEKSWGDIARALGTYPNKVRRDATKLGILSRDKSEAQKVALSSGRHIHPTVGKEHSEETKKKISESQGKVWDGLTDQERKERSEIGLESWNKKTESQKSEFFKKSHEAMREAAQNGSKMENYLYYVLINLGYRVDKHKEQVLQNEKFHIDLYLPAHRIAIEVDGPSHFEPVFGEEKLQKRQAADAVKTGLILGAGVVLIRVKLTKRESQRYMRTTADKVASIVDEVRTNFPKENERYFEV